jgi:hypothetical protein
MIFITCYLIVSLIVAVSAFSNAGASAGFSALGGSFCGFAAGAGLREMLHGTSMQKIIGVVMAIVIMGIAQLLGQYYSVRLFDLELDGGKWGWIGFLICLILTPRGMIYRSGEAAT